MPMVSMEEVGLGDKDVKVGDELMFKVTKIEGDNMELSYSPEVAQEAEVTEDNAQAVPLERLEKSLPTAER